MKHNVCIVIFTHRGSEGMSITVFFFFVVVIFLLKKNYEVCVPRTVILPATFTATLMGPAVSEAFCCH